MGSDYWAKELNAFSEEASDGPLGFPRFGLRTTYPAREVTDWEQTRDPHAAPMHTPAGRRA